MRLDKRTSSADTPTGGVPPSPFPVPRFPFAALRIYRGWIVVIAITLSLAVSSGGRFLFGVVLKPVSEEFGWSRAELAFAVTINVLLLSCLQPCVGWLVDRVGSRRVLLVGVVLTGLAMIPLTVATALWQVYIAYGVLAAFGFACTSPVNTTALVNGWFERRRGLALSLATSGSAYGQLLIVPIATAIMLHWSWRASYWAVSAALFLLILPIVALCVYDAPGRGLRATGREGSHSELGNRNSERLTRPAARSPRPDNRVSLRQAMAGPAYWQLSFGMFVCGFTMSFTSVHLVPYLTDMPEHSAHTMQTAASLALSVVGACSIVGAIVLGLVADRRGHRQILALTYFLRGLAFLLLLAVGSWIPGIFLAAIVLGISWTSTTPLGSAIAADLYGRASLGSIFGFIFTFMNIGSAFGAWLAALDRDIFGNYHASLIANVALGFAAAAATLAIRRAPAVSRDSREFADASVGAVAD